MTTTSRLPGTPSPAVVRAAAVLRAIAAADGSAPSVSELAEELGAPRSSISNVLAALASEGLVRKTGGGFAIGPAVVGLASTFLKHDDPVQRFHELAPALPALSGETVQLGTLQGADVLYLARHDGSQPITLTSGIGRRLPATSTAIGKAILSGWPPAEVERVVGPRLRQLTPKSHATLETLSDDLAGIRARGYAIDDEEAAPNVVCIAVALVDQGGSGGSAISTTLFKDRRTPELEASLVEDLHALADFIAAI